MTFQVDSGMGFVNCDGCSEYFQNGDGTDFNDTMTKAKAAGWRAYKGPDNEWAHSCPVCVATFAKDQRR